MLPTKTTNARQRRRPPWRPLIPVLSIFAAAACGQGGDAPSYSGTAEAIINGDPYPEPPPDVTDPIDPAPGRPSIVENGPFEVKLSYTCGGHATRHDLYRQTEGSTYWYRVTTDYSCSGSGTITDSSAYPVRDYCYKIVASNFADTEESSTRCLRTPHAPKYDSGSDLDAPRPPSSSAQYEMTSGRLSKIPVTAFWTNRFDGGLTASGNHDPIFRTYCSPSNTKAGRCDTAMIVTFNSCDSAGWCTTPRTYFNDDDYDPYAHGTGSGSGSWVDPPAQPYGVDRYRVYVYSNQRATSRTSIYYSLDGGTTWNGLAYNVEVGGTVVKVGSLHDDDTLEVMTRTDGAGDDDTHMLLFTTSNSTLRKERFSIYRTLSDHDPLIRMYNDNWKSSTNNYVLLGKASTSNQSKDGIETYVDLVHGPEGPRTVVSMETDVMLEPGTYEFTIDTALSRPVGGYVSDDPSTQHLSSDMPDIDGKSCPGGTTYARGRPNAIALTMRLEKEWCFYWSCSWQTVDRLDIPRGAFGSKPGHGTDRFVIPANITQGARYRVSVDIADQGIGVSTWSYQRNVTSTELKVVSYNAYFSGNSFNTAKYKNIANLLGTRGEVDTTYSRVSEPMDQAPWQWEADIIGLQEVCKDEDFSGTVLDELNRPLSLRWEYAQGHGENWFQPDFGKEGPGMNPLYVNDLFWPDEGSNSSIFYDQSAKDHAGCSPTPGCYLDGGSPPQEICPPPPPERMMQCHLSDVSLTTGNYAVSAKTSVWRDGSADRPVAVFNVHLQASDGPGNFDDRVAELDDLINRIDLLLEADPLTFNSYGSSDPMSSGNRIVIIGDWNIRSHECGEHYWMIRRLRDHFGWAIDSAMAVTDGSGGLSLGTHDQGHPYVGGVPSPYQRATAAPSGEWTAWRSAPTFSWSSVYPWWAVDYRDKTSGDTHMNERLSMMALVGKGWQKDNPVVTYSVMNDSNHTSPIHETKRAVEMWRPDDEYDTGSVANDEFGYRPSYSLGKDSYPGGGTKRGAPALHSDHRPIGMRIRVH